jgi:biopolymer transport protein ExbD
LARAARRDSGPQKRKKEEILMAMAVGGGGDGTKSDINMTPLIDVLLVLLIIFMVITPLTPKGLEALVPQPNPDQEQQLDANIRTVVVSIDANKQIRINRDAYTIGVLEDALRDIFKTRAERVMFVSGDGSLNFEAVAEIIDIGKAAGVDKIGLVTEKMAGG